MISTAPAVCCGYFSWPRTVVAVYIARENDPSVQEIMMEYSQLNLDVLKRRATRLVS